MRSLDLPYSPAETEIILDELFAEAKKYNSRQLESDWFFVYTKVGSKHRLISKNFLIKIATVNVSCSRTTASLTKQILIKNAKIEVGVLNRL